MAKKKSKLVASRYPLVALFREYWYVLVALVLLVIPLYFYILKDLPSPTRLRSGSFPVSTQIFDRHGQLLYTIYTDQNRTPVKLSDLPDYVAQATIAIEDKHFYRHYGIAPEGILRAAINIIFRQKLQGGSTITQQLVKTALLTPERTLQRKVREALLAVATDFIYSKDQILEMYLNFTPYGGTAYGLESAAQTYFDKSAHDLTLAEAALLAGLPQAPTRYSPFGSSPENAQARQKEVLRRMTEDGYITDSARQQAETEPLNFATSKIAIKAPHFVLYVKDLLVEKYGLRTVEQGGLRVITSLDLELQEYAQASLSAQIQKLIHLRVGNGAALVTQPASGEILAMVGSRDYFDTEHDGNVNVTLRPRQPGSSIKPLNYASALDKRLITPATLLLDIPTCFLISGQPPYCPKNYDDTFHGPVQVRFALGNSYNLPATKVLALNTVADLVASASAMGITGWDDPSRFGLSLTLGGGEVRMVDMAVAFGVFANAGTKVPLQPILKVEDYQGNILEEYRQPQANQVLSPAAAYLISNILSDPAARTAAFGDHSQLVIPKHIVAVKTGTTNDLRDNWTVGYTPQFFVAVWVGNNDATPMSALTSGVTGAAPIWNQLMRQVLTNRQSIWFAKPPDLVSLDICALSGLLPNPDRPCDARSELFIKGTEPQTSDNSYRGTWINKDTNLPAFTGDAALDAASSDNLELREHLVLSDPFTLDFCFSCSWPPALNADGTPKSSGGLVYPQQTVDLNIFSLH